MPHEASPSPVYHRKLGRKHHLISGGNGTRLKVVVTGRTVPDVTGALTLVVAVLSVGGQLGQPRERPKCPHGAKGYASWRVRRNSAHRTLAIVSRRGNLDICGLDELRYVIKQTFALLHRFKRLVTHWELRLDAPTRHSSRSRALINWRLNKSAA
ncbi:hypothetical protein [Kitasatospora sp. NPDC090308]|uniref:hypothetical protein n=1 Tax=Kitasatospora sp. NPDC090308 TaxID=3364082 RepID=UPI003825C3AC